MSYVPHSAADVRAMLQTIGVQSLDDLFSAIPPALRAGELTGIPAGRSEWDAVRLVSGLADRNEALVCFAGAGLYDHYIPATVDHILRRSEFYTAYTPYQAEVSQGTLQVIYEFQSMVCELTGMDVANASMYDGASALAEAALMAVNITGRNGVVVAGKLHPYTRQVLETYLEAAGERAIVPFSPAAAPPHRRCACRSR